MKFKELFNTEKPIIGMIHLAGKDPVKRALDELKIFEEEGISGAIIENYHSKDVEHIIKTLEAAKKKDLEIILGVNILPNDFWISFQITARYDAKFVQLDYVSGKYISMNGRASSSASQVKQLDQTRYKDFRNNCAGIPVLGGVYPKYYVPVAYSNLEEDLRKGMERSEAIVVTGEGTGMETPLDKIRNFRKIIGNYPLIVGAGLNTENAEEQLNIADGAIVGSALKINNNTENPLDVGRIRELMRIVERVRNNHL